MILTCRIDQIPARDRAAYLACGTREAPNILTLDTSKPCFAALYQIGPLTMRPPEPIPADTSPEQERIRAQQGGCCGEPAIEDHSSTGDNT